MKSIAGIISLFFLISCSTYGPLTATGNMIAQAKGEACRNNILYIIPLSFDNSIYAAARNGKISEISTVDLRKFRSIIYNSDCTVVHGTSTPKLADPPESEVVGPKEEPKEVRMIEPKVKKHSFSQSHNHRLRSGLMSF